MKVWLSRLTTLCSLPLLVSRTRLIGGESTRARIFLPHMYLFMYLQKYASEMKRMKGGKCLQMYVVD